MVEKNKVCLAGAVRGIVLYRSAWDCFIQIEDRGVGLSRAVDWPLTLKGAVCALPASMMRIPADVVQKRLTLGIEQHARGAFASMFSSAEQQQRELDEARRVVSEYVIEEIDMRSLDRVFVQSARLDSNAIASFVEALCGIFAPQARATPKPGPVFSRTPLGIPSTLSWHEYTCFKLIG